MAIIISTRQLKNIERAKQKKREQEFLGTNWKPIEERYEKRERLDNILRKSKIKENGN